MGKKKQEDDPFIFFNIKTDPTFPKNALLIVDKEKKHLVILDAAEMDKWGEAEAFVEADGPRKKLPR